MPGKIFIESRPVTQENPRSAASDHLYLVYEDELGHEFVIRGGHENDHSFGGFISGLFGKAGPILTEAGIPIGMSKDRRNDKQFPQSRRHRQLTDAELGGRDPAVVWEQMKVRAQYIDTQQVDYWLDGPNSNSTIASVLDAAGINVNEVLPTNDRVFPGTDRDNMEALLPIRIKDGQYPTYDPAADNPPIIETRTPLSSTSSAIVDEGGGFFSSVGSFFSGIGSGIADFFGGGSDVGSSPFNPFPTRGYSRASGISPADLMRHQLAQRQSPLDIDKILSEAVAKNADSLFDRLIAKNPNMFQKTLGQVLTSSLETFTSEIRKSKSRSFEEAFSNVFSGQSGQQIASNIGTMAAGEIINYGIDEIFYKERTRVRMQETERSRQQREGLRLSEGQQAAALLRAIQKGQRNM